MHQIFFIATGNEESTKYYLTDLLQEIYMTYTQCMVINEGDRI